MTGIKPLDQAVAAVKRAFVHVGVFSLGANVLMLAVPLYMLQLFDRVITTRSSDTLLVLTLMVVVSVLVMAALEAVRGRLTVRIAGWLDREVSGPVLAGAVARALRGVRQEAQGLRDLGTVRGFLSGTGVFPLMDAPWVPVFLAVVFLMHPILGWIATSGAAVIFAFAVLNDAVTREALKRAGGAHNKALYDADAAVRNADVIEAMGMLPQVLTRWRRVAGAASAEQRTASDRGGAIASAAKFTRLGLQIAMLGTGAYLAMTQVITPGTMIAASIIMARALAPAEQAIQGWRALVAARAAWERLRELLADSGAEAPATPLPEPEGRLVVDRVTYLPPGQEAPTVKEVSFALAPGEALGLIGPTGAGKTTLVRLVVGSLVPRLGSVRLDGAEMSAWASADRGPHVGYLPQDIELFSGTVRDNIARFTECEADAVLEAATMAGVHELVLGLPQGYDTEIGPGGHGLSGGQRQRIGLARALFGQPKLLVLDEPNANLDARGEQALIEAIATMRAARATIVLIAQRPQVLSQMDKILVLREGAAQAYGPRDEVLAQLRGRPGDEKPRPEEVTDATIGLRVDP